MLDVVVDGIAICDDGFLENAISTLKRRLDLLGARRVLLEDGSWYWDLKSDYKFGEIVEL